MSMDAGGPGAPQGLDFETAQTEGAAGRSALLCNGCQREITNQYFTAGEAIFCDACRHQYEAELRNQSGLGLFAKAGFLGLLAALAGAALWGGVIWITSYELGLIAVVVGFMVGAAVKVGTGGRGGLVYQFMAVAFTYLAVSLAYVPLVFQGFQEIADEETALLEEGEEGMLPPLEGEVGEFDEYALAEEALDVELAFEEAAFEGEELAFEDLDADAEVGMAGMLVFGVGMLAVAAALPFLAGVENIIGLAIIGFALWQAWSINKKVDFSVSGPYHVGDGA